MAGTSDPSVALVMPDNLREASLPSSSASIKQSLCDKVVQQVIESVKADGYGTDTLSLVKQHFVTLPSRYTLSMDPSRHEDVLLHMQLLNTVREQIGEDSTRSQNRSLMQSEAGPVVSVRRVGLGAVDSSHSLELEHDAVGPSTREGVRAEEAAAEGSRQRQGIPIKQPGRRKRSDSVNDSNLWLPRPTFGSCTNLSILQAYGAAPSPTRSKAARSREKQSPHGIPVPAGSRGQGGSSSHSRSAPSAGRTVLGGRRGSMSSLEEGEDADSERSPGSSVHGEGGPMGSPGSSVHGPRPPSSTGDGWSEGELNVLQGWEVTIAAPDRPGLLTSFTSAISHSDQQLDIREAHVFSSADGLALQVFVVTSPNPHDETEELQDALKRELRERWEDRGNQRSAEQSQTSNLKAAVEAMCYEDWSLDAKDLQLTAKLGGGSSGRLYKGNYRGQEVAVKVISLALTEDPLEDRILHQQTAPCFPDLEDPSEKPKVGTPPLVSSAAELLQCFKREVAIMRIVRHKNVLQFIGACSAFPRLYVVTELMSKGSIREVLDRHGAGLPLLSALRVFRDAARGMDFLHRRGIVHRDLKAANLLVDENDVVKVCDFGVARLISPALQEKGSDVHQAQAGHSTLEPISPDSSADLTAETGTYRWMAPEVLEHRPYGFKADVFSFGITMWEVLSGQIPYMGMTPLQAAVGVVQRQLRPEIPAGIPQQLAVLIQSCWNTDPTVRPPFAEILAHIDDLMWRLAEIPLPANDKSGSADSGNPVRSDSRAVGGFTGLWKKTFGSKK